MKETDGQAVIALENGKKKFNTFISVGPWGEDEEMRYNIRRYVKGDDDEIGGDFVLTYRATRGGVSYAEAEVDALLAEEEGLELLSLRSLGLPEETNRFLWALVRPLTNCLKVIKKCLKRALHNFNYAMFSPLPVTIATLLSPLLLIGRRLPPHLGCHRDADAGSRRGDGLPEGHGLGPQPHRRRPAAVRGQGEHSGAGGHGGRPLDWEPLQASEGGGQGHPSHPQGAETPGGVQASPIYLKHFLTFAFPHFSASTFGHFPGSAVHNFHCILCRRRHSYQQKAKKEEAPAGGDYDSRRREALKRFEGGGPRAFFSPKATSSPKEGASAAAAASLSKRTPAAAAAPAPAPAPAPAQRALHAAQPAGKKPLKERSVNVPKVKGGGAPPPPPPEVAAIQAPPPQQPQQEVIVQQQFTSAQAMQVENQLPAQIMQLLTQPATILDIAMAEEGLNNLSLLTHPDSQQQQQELFGLENNDPLFSQVSHCIHFPLGI